MRHHAQVAPTFWTRGTGKRLRGKPFAQALANYLMTGPHATMTGLYHISVPIIAYELGWSESDVRQALGVLSEEDFAHLDEDVELMFLPSGARTQIGESMKVGDNKRVQVIRALHATGDHAFVHRFVELYDERFNLTRDWLGTAKPPKKGVHVYLEATSKPLTKGVLEDPYKGSDESTTTPCKGGSMGVVDPRSPDPDPDPDLNSEEDPPDRSTPHAGEQPRRGALERNFEPATEVSGVLEVWDDYREILGLPNAELDAARAEAIYERLRKGATRDQLRTVWRNAMGQDWLRKRRFPVHVMLGTQDQFEALLEGSASGDNAEKPTGLDAVKELRRRRSGG